MRKSLLISSAFMCLALLTPVAVAVDSAPVPYQLPPAQVQALFANGQMPVIYQTPCGPVIGPPNSTATGACIPLPAQVEPPLATPAEMAAMRAAGAAGFVPPLTQVQQTAMANVQAGFPAQAVALPAAAPVQLGQTVALPPLNPNQMVEPFEPGANNAAIQPAYQAAPQFWVGYNVNNPAVPAAQPALPQGPLPVIADPAVFGMQYQTPGQTQAQVQPQFQTGEASVALQQQYQQLLGIYQQLQQNPQPVNALELQQQYMQLLSNYIAQQQFLLNAASQQIAQAQSPLIVDPQQQPFQQQPAVLPPIVGAQQQPIPEALAVAGSLTLITPAQVKQAIAARTPMFILDVRSEMVRDVEGHINGDISVPFLPRENFAARVAAVIPNTGLPVVVYCHDGIWSAQAGQILQQMGYTPYLMGAYRLW